MKKVLVISNTAFSIKKFRFHYLHKLSKKFKIHIRTPDKIQNLEKKKNITFSTFNFNNFFIDFFKTYFFLKKNNFDLIIVYSFKFQIVISIIKYFLKIKTLYLIAGKGSLFLIKKILLKKFLNFILSLFIFNKENNLCFINPYDLKFFNRHYNLNKKKIFLIPTEGFDKKNIKIKKNYKKNFIFFGRIIKQKGIFDYLEAAKIIKKDFPKLNFYIAGSLSKNIIGQSSIFSKKVFKAIESSNNIKFIQMKKNYSFIYPKMDCLISPSFTEGAGTSVMEAMYSGLFIIAYNNNGHKYLLSSTKNIICKKNNVTELVNQIKFFLNLKTKIIEKIQRHSRQVVLKKFNTKIITIKFNQILKVIM